MEEGGGSGSGKWEGEAILSLLPKETIKGNETDFLVFC
jgi:hypothetical protein